MKDGQHPDESAFANLLSLPRWITAGRAQTVEDAAFLSGAALSCLHLVMRQSNTPQALLRARLALRAAEASLQASNRPERAAALRDEVHLLRPGDLPGPGGAIYQSWQRAVAQPLSVKTLTRALPKSDPAQIATWLDAGQGAPIPRAAQVFEAVLAQTPRGEATAMILADAALSQALGWDHLLPCLSVGLTRADLRKRGTDLQMACHRAAVRAAKDSLPMARDLSRRAAYLTAIAPKLRAKRAGEAVQMFLTRDAVSPSDLPLPDRAARRLCNRLVTLGAVRELTGRDMFRLYGIAP